MCELKKRYSHGKQVFVTAYKMVAKRISDGTYHSLAMGFEYPKIGTWGDIPIVKEQKAISSEFSGSILTCSFAFKENMRGRTAAFLRLYDALYMMLDHRDFLSSTYSAAIVKVELKGALLKGSYGRCEVVAGRQMKIIEEIQE